LSQLFFFCELTTDFEIGKIIDLLDMNKSTGPNSIPIFILKIMKPFFSFWLSKIINLSIEKSIFPDLLKMAKITPLHKKDSKLNHLNYRPISLLSALSKIFEKVLYVRMYNFITNNNLFYGRQYGFRHKHSTNHALISLTENIKSHLDKKNIVCGIFIDLEKAFDTVNHAILSDKLYQYGFRGDFNSLMKSYLFNRKQFVSINGFDSKIKTITCGVPQGSSLGPLLFLIYINDFRHCLINSYSGHFADDTYIMYANKNIKSIETVINYELKLAIKWMNLNKLSLNVDKTNLILFHSKYKKLDLKKFSIKLNGKKLLPVDFVKYLGMYIDKHLSWDYHISQLAKKLSRSNGILSKLRYNTPINVRIQVYYAIFYSYLNYGCNMWGLTFEANLNIIRILQKKCLRIITFSDFNSHTNQLFLDHEILKLDEIIKLNQLKLIYDYKNNLLPGDIQSLFNLERNIHSYETSGISKDLLYIPSIQSSNYGNKSLKFQGPYLWNKTVKAYPNLNDVNSSYRFKHFIKSIFLTSYK